MNEATIARWKLRAEEYRAIAEGLISDSNRQTYEQLAETCDRIADHPEGPTLRLTDIDCLTFAVQCRELAARARTAETASWLRAIAQQWEGLVRARAQDPARQ